MSTGPVEAVDLNLIIDKVIEAKLDKHICELKAKIRVLELRNMELEERNKKALDALVGTA